MESRGNKNVYYHSVLLAFLKWNRFVIPMKSRILNKDEYGAQLKKEKKNYPSNSLNHWLFFIFNMNI